MILVTGSIVLPPKRCLGVNTVWPEEIYRFVVFDGSSLIGAVFQEKFNHANLSCLIQRN